MDFWTTVFLTFTEDEIHPLNNKKGFPTIFIGKRMVVYRDKFIQWMDEQVSA